MSPTAVMLQPPETSAGTVRRKRSRTSPASPVPGYGQMRPSTSAIIITLLSLDFFCLIVYPIAFYKTVVGELAGINVHNADDFSTSFHIPSRRSARCHLAAQPPGIIPWLLFTLCFLYPTYVSIYSIPLSFGLLSQSHSLPCYFCP